MLFHIIIAQEVRDMYQLIRSKHGDKNSIVLSSDAERSASILASSSAIGNSKSKYSWLISYPKISSKVARTLSRFKVRCKWFSLVGADYKYSFFSNDNKNKNAEQITTEGPAAVS